MMPRAGKNWMIPFTNYAIAVPAKKNPRWQLYGSWRKSLLRAVCWGIFLTVYAHGSSAHAGTLTQKDTQILGKALGFLDPAPPGDGVIAIAYNAANPASKADADAIAGFIGDGLAAGSQTLKLKIVDAATLGNGAGYSAIIAAQGASGDAVMAAAKGHKIVCASGEIAEVQAGKCIMSIQSDPKVDIGVNHAAALATGIDFASAFRMMIHEF